MTGYVYAILADNGLVKLGYSKAPQRRLSEINSDASATVELLGYVPATKSQETELHRLLVRWRVKGERFRHEGPVAFFTSTLPIRALPRKIRPRRDFTPRPVVARSRTVAFGPMETKLRRNLFTCANKFATARGILLSTLGRFCINDGGFFKDVEDGMAFTVRRYTKVMVWLSENWPAGAEWPSEVQRPAPEQVAA